MPYGDTVFLKGSVDVMTFFDADQLRSVTPDIEHKTFNKGETVIFKGQITEGFYVVKKGRVAVLLKPPRPGAPAPAVELKEGDFFGEMSLLEDNSAMASVRAAEDGTDILTIPSASFQKLLGMQPQLRLALLAKIAARRPPKK